MLNDTSFNINKKGTFYILVSFLCPKMDLLYVIFFCISFKHTSTYFLNQDEVQVSLDLLKELKIRQCMFIGDVRNEEAFNNIKQFSLVNIPTTYSSYGPLVKHIDKTEMIYPFTGIIFKEKDLGALEEISQYFEKVCEMLVQLA